MILWHNNFDLLIFFYGVLSPLNKVAYNNTLKLFTFIKIMWKRKKKQQCYGLLGCRSMFQFIFDLFTRRRSSAGREGKTIGLHAVELIFPLLSTKENVVCTSLT